MVRADWVPLEDERRGYYAVPDGAGPFPAVVVFQEAFGVNDYVQSEVRRLAASGYCALAPDLFDGVTYAYGDERVMDVLAGLTDPEMLEYAAAAIDFLALRPEARSERIGTLGFCMGGRLAVLTALTCPGEVAAAVSFYGGNIAPQHQRLFVPLLDRLPSLTVPTLFLNGADDASIGAYEHERIVEALSGAKAEYGLRVFKDAGHAFASRDREQYVPRAAEMAWDEALAWLARYLA